MAAPAKINLVLEVLRKREDGFHEVDTILQELRLSDRVSIRTNDHPGMDVAGRWSEGCPADATNLAWQAAMTLLDLIGDPVQGLRIGLDKNIPPARGLGGGSSDAAATLRLLGSALGVPRNKIEAAAARTGSDVPFFLEGGTARAQGRGEIISGVPRLREHGVVLFVPTETLEQKTATLFKKLGRLPFTERGTVSSFLQAGSGFLDPADLSNSFERVAFEAFPGLRDLRAVIEDAIDSRVSLTGAGPTLFWIGPLQAAVDISRRASGLPCEVIETSTAR